MSLQRPWIGVSARRIAADPAGRGSRRRAQWGIDAVLADALRRAGAAVVLLPVPDPGVAADEASALAARLDGLLLQGGSDIAPERWGEVARHPEWAGDPWRDAFEFALFAAARARGLPVLGICRGMQLINVACGGTLLQDLAGAARDAGLHDVPAAYDRHRHRVRLAADGLLARLHGATEGQVSSAHHQAVDHLGAGLVVEAWADDDGIEALRGSGDPWLFGVQWHPEFHPAPGPALSGEALLRAFVDAARERTSA